MAPTCRPPLPQTADPPGHVGLCLLRLQLLRNTKLGSSGYCVVSVGGWLLKTWREVNDLRAM